MIDVIILSHGLGYCADMMSSRECLARAAELEAKMALASSGAAREEYAQLAAHWRILADIAAYEEQEAARPG